MWMYKVFYFRYCRRYECILMIEICNKSEQKHTSFVLWTYLQENNPNWLFNHSQTRIYVKWLLFPLHFQSMQICLNNYKIRDSWGKISLTCLVALTDNDITWHACKVRITTIGFARLRNLPFEYVKGEMAYDKQILMNVVKVICLIMKSTINILKVSASM